MASPGSRFASAGASSPFEAAAAADLVRVLVRAEPPVLQADLADAGALTTQARLTSLGDSTSFASTPYPGSLVVSAPGLVDGLLAGAVDLPDYPLIVSSSYPSQPHSRLTAATLALSTDSAGNESRSVAIDGASRSSATVEADPGTGAVVARADTTLGSFDLGPLLRLGGLRSSASATLSPDGTLHRRSGFSIASIEVLGQRLELTDDGLALPGASLPADAHSVVDAAAPLIAALADAGVGLRVLEAVETPDGTTSAGLEITRVVDTQVNGIVATVAVTLGRSSASVSAQTSQATDGTVGLQPSPASPVEPSADLALGPLPGTSPPLSPAVQLPSDPARARTIGSLRPETVDGGAFYPVLVAVGFVLVVLVDLFRKRGVRLTWIS